MEVVQPHDPVEFLAAAEPLLLADEARHNLILGLAGTLRDDPGLYAEQRLWLVRDAGTVVGAALQTPPHNLVLGPLRSDAAATLAAAIDGDLPGVVGAVPDVDGFAAAWEARRPVRAEARFEQGVYALDQPIPPRPASGRPRAASTADEPLLVEWLGAFSREALREEELDEPRIRRIVASRLAGPEAGFVLWDDDGPVSVAGYGSPTPSGIRIGPVYTPPEHRGRGYGSAVTAAVSEARLRAGRRFCFLYTDLANPTSNGIYIAIGYRRVCDSRELAFVPR